MTKLSRSRPERRSCAATKRALPGSPDWRASRPCSSRAWKWRSSSSRSAPAAVFSCRRAWARLRPACSWPLQVSWCAVRSRGFLRTRSSSPSGSCSRRSARSGRAKASPLSDSRRCSSSRRSRQSQSCAALRRRLCRDSAHERSARVVRAVLRRWLARAGDPRRRSARGGGCGVRAGLAARRWRCAVVRMPRRALRQRGREGAPLTAGEHHAPRCRLVARRRVTSVARGLLFRNNRDTPALHSENVASRFKAVADKPLNFILKGITMKTKLLVSAIAVLTLSAAALSAGAATMRTDLLGEPAQASAAVRTLVINGNTKYVNVKHGELIRFVENGREFAWNFDGVAQPQPFDLAQVAPAGILDHSVKVYVQLGDQDVSADS